MTQRGTFFVSDSDICPIKAFKLYKFKLHPDVDYLWQRPKAKLIDVNKEWYDAAPIGRDPLNSAMKTIGHNAKLSVIYTNHCIRATVVTNLNEEGFEARDIMATTGHKSEASIRSYAKKCPLKKRRLMADALASKFEEKPEKKTKGIPTSTVTSKNCDKNQAVSSDKLDDTDQSLINFELFPDFEDADLVKVLTQIENENKDLVPQQEKNVQLQAIGKLPNDDKQRNQAKTINYSAVANISNRNPMMPNMYFPNSNVTINYNFNK